MTHPLSGALVLKRIALIAAALVSLGHLNNVSANLITNGSFEDPSIANGSFSYLPSIPSWTLASGPAIEIQNQVAGSPFAGRQFVELDSSANSSMYQDLATVAGDTYRLSFAYSPRPGIAANSNGIDVSWNGGVVLSLAQSGVGLPDTSWTVYNLDLKALSNSTRLQFTATGISDSFGGYLDLVSVNAVVPEPTTFVSLGLAGVVILAVRRRGKPGPSGT